MSFVEVSPESHFPIQNLPYGVFSTPDNVSHHSIVNLQQLIYICSAQYRSRSTGSEARLTIGRSRSTTVFPGHVLMDGTC